MLPYCQGQGSPISTSQYTIYGEDDCLLNKLSTHYYFNTCHQQNLHRWEVWLAKIPKIFIRIATYLYACIQKCPNGFETVKVLVVILMRRRSQQCLLQILCIRSGIDVNIEEPYILLITLSMVLSHPATHTKLQ